eukprot:1145755-Pelagomonas_calceolata.AAC.2
MPRAASTPPPLDAAVGPALLFAAAQEVAGNKQHGKEKKTVQEHECEMVISNSAAAKGIQTRAVLRSTDSTSISSGLFTLLSAIDQLRSRSPGH